MIETELLKISLSSRGLSDEDPEELELGDIDLDEDDDDDDEEDGGGDLKEGAEPKEDDGLVTEE